MSVVQRCAIYTTSVDLAKYSKSMTRRVTPKTAPVPEAFVSVPKKYYNQRYRFFCKFDHGIQMDAESWYSVTPETIAEHIAERCRCGVVLDAFAGCGGNAIQFAFTCERVIAVELDQARLNIARNNARVYGVEDRIEFIHGDAIQVLQALHQEQERRGQRLVDVVFLSPPWGGPDYLQAPEFNTKDIAVSSGARTINGHELLQIAANVSPDVAYFLPRNTVPAASAKALHETFAKLHGAVRVEFEQHIVEERTKTCCMYFGDLVAKRTLGL